MRQNEPHVPREFMDARISCDQAVKVLKKHGLLVTNEEASSILDFLYLLAKTTGSDEILEAHAKEPLVEIEPGGVDLA